MNKLIDINKTLDLVKLKFYNEYLYTNHIYDEGHSDYHREITNKVVEDVILPLNLDKNSVILDVGCGPGYFLDKMVTYGYSNLTGITLSVGDIEICRNNGHTVKEYDLSFLPQTDGYTDECVDFIFCRHALEHSPYPIFTLMEYNRVLKQGCKIYIEVPQPNCERRHEYNLNHYSILGQHQLFALLHRCGFDVEVFHTIEFVLKIPDKNNELVDTTEKFYSIVATKTRPLDVK